MNNIQHLIEDKRKMISDVRFFSSDILRKHLRSMATTMLRKYKIRQPVHVVIEYDSARVKIAKTDGMNILVNTNSDPMKVQPDRTRKFEILKAFLYHEVGHILYSDFEIMGNYKESILEGRMPYADSARDEYAGRIEEISSYLNSGDERNRRAAFARTALQIENILEDAYIEARLRQRYPGSVKKAIDYARTVCYMLVPSLEEHIANEDGDKFDAIMNLMLTYAVNDEYMPFVNGEDERIIAVDRCIPYIDAAVFSGKSIIRFRQLNNIIYELWPYIYEYLENPNRDHEQDNEMENHSSMPSGVGKDFEEGNEIDNPHGNREDELIIPDEEDGGIIHEEYEVDETLDSAAEINRLVEEMQSNDSYMKSEELFEGELNHFASDIEYTDIHKGITLHVERMASVPYDYELQYEDIREHVEALSSKLAYSLRTVFSDVQKGAKQKNRLIGKKIRAASLFRPDQRIFYNTRLPRDIGVCIAHLGDESWSMNEYERYVYVRQASLVLYDFCRKLNIPASFYGHTADEEDWGTVSMRAYAEFKKVDDRDKFRMMDIQPRSSNRDGAAIKYMCERLLDQPEPLKILFITCDGLPIAYGYRGTPANEDIISIVEHYEKRGIRFFALAIGADKDRIHSIYGNRFVDITNLADLPERLGELMKVQLKRVV